MQRMANEPEVTPVTPPAQRRPRLVYHIENPIKDNRVDHFLRAFAAILEFSDYRPLLDSYCTSSAKCNRCAVSCPVYLATGDPRDIPCYRTNLLLDIYRRYFTIGGSLRARLTSGFELTVIRSRASIADLRNALQAAMVSTRPEQLGAVAQA